MFLVFGSAGKVAPPTSRPAATVESDAFAVAAEGKWKVAFDDPGTGDWHDGWFLDGEVGTVANDARGMTLTAGPTPNSDADHIVLWTKQSFEGDVKVEFTWTRTDHSEKAAVNILYIQATGSGEGPYAEDLTEWNELRRVPAMKTYFNHVNTYHVSYSALRFGRARLRSRPAIPARSRGAQRDRSGAGLL